MGVRRKIEETPREKRKKRNPNPTILIVCEGKDTEPNYFKHFKTRYINVNIELANKSSIGKNKARSTDPVSLVKEASAYKNDKYTIREADGDRVWCIFDVDVDRNNNDALRAKQVQLDNAYKLAKKDDIRLGISNPCFELWYLLHFCYTTGFIKDYESMKKLLESRTSIKDYDKNIDVFDYLKDNIDIAIDNSEKLKKHYEDLGIVIANVETNEILLNMKNIVESNPYTNIHELVSYIERLEEHKRK